jgi:two-component system, sensor histidine kinase and response regulator
MNPDDKVGRLEKKIRILEKKLFRSHQNRLRTEESNEKNEWLLRLTVADLKDATRIMEIQKRELEVSTSELKNINEKMWETQEKLKASEQEANAGSRAKMRLLANISHELRTPLNAVIGMARLLRESHVDKTQEELTRIIFDSAQALLLMLDNVLDVARADMGKMELHETYFSLQKLVDNVLEVFAFPAEVKQLELAGYFDPNIDTEIFGDPGRLQQVLLNMIGNAIKFTSQGHVLLSCQRAEVRDGENAVFQFQIQDSGIGVLASRKNDIFEPFIQADDSMSRKYGGAGLGLAISRDLVHLMNGEISMESDGKSGTLFTVSLPFKLRAKGHKESEEKTDRGGRAILLLQQSLNCCFLESELERMGIEVLTCSSATEAMELIQKGSSQKGPSYVVIDLSALLQMEGELRTRLEDLGDKPDAKTIIVTPFSHKHSGMDLAWLPNHELLRYPLRRYRVKQAFSREPTAGPHPYGKADGQLQAAEPTNVQIGKILIVEDNSANQKVAALTLERMGYVVDVKNGGSSALRQISTSQYDAILMDCQMPEMDGFETTKRLRARESAGEKFSKGGRIPIIAMTANAFKKDKENMIDSGMDDMIYKPLDPQVLKEILEKWLKQSMSAQTQIHASNHP